MLKNKLFGIIVIGTLIIALIPSCSIIKDKDKDKKGDSLFNFSNPSEFRDFKEGLHYLDYIAYNDTDNQFIETLKTFFNDNIIMMDSKEISFDEFTEKYIFDNTSILYLEDINNDGENDLIIASRFAGTGSFSTFTNIFLKDGTAYKNQIINEKDQITTNFLDMVSYKEKNYIFTTTLAIDNVFEWKDGGFKLVFDESKFIETDHLKADYSDINKRIYEKYNIAQIEKELSEKNIDFSNTGYLNKEILTSYFKIKEFISIEDKKSLSNMVSFPIIYTKDNKDYKVYNREEFIDQYEFIITDNIKTMVENSNYEDIFSSWRGAMIGGGAIWFTTTIYAINGSLK